MINICYLSLPEGSMLSREYLLIRQGLINNERVNLVEKDKSDFIFIHHSIYKRYLQSDPCAKQELIPEKIIFIDYHDRPNRIVPIECKAYFKRSWVVKTMKKDHLAKKSISRPSNFYPLAVAIMDESIIREDMERDVVLSCTLRRKHEKYHLARLQVLKLLEKMNIQGKTQIGAVNEGAMYRFNAPDMREYFKLLKRSRLVVTCNPSQWEGDHRTWEAFANGALVFVDKTYTPMTHPLIDGKHCIIYEISDSGFKKLREKILYFLENTAHASAIAKAGFDFAMKYHRASNRIDEILERIL